MCEIVKERFQQEESGAGRRKENEYKYIMRKIQSATLFQYLSFLPSYVVDLMERNSRKSRQSYRGFRLE